MAHFYVAGFSYYEGCEAILEGMHVGNCVILNREPQNSYDPNAISIYFDDFKLGYVPQEQNEFISKLLDMGYEDILEAKIQRISPESRPEHQVMVIIYLLRNEMQRIVN